METLHILLTDPTLQMVVLGCGLLGAVCGVVGSLATLCHQNLLGDGISHAALPGIVLAFLAAGSKNPGILLLGAAFTGFLAAFCINGISARTRLPFDSVLALVMSAFFGGGLALLTYLQKIPNANQAGLKSFLFGQASTLLAQDVAIIAIGGGFVVLVVLLFWKELALFGFDRAFALCAGFAPRPLQLLLSCLIVATVVLGLRTVGVVLMSALLIAPAVAARQFARRLSTMAALAALFGAGAGVLGAVTSAFVPRMPTGPAVVIYASCFAFCSILWAPYRGILYKLWQRRRAGGTPSRRRAGEEGPYVSAD